MSVSPVFQANPELLAPREDGLDAADRRKRVYFEVFGCQMNKLDAELMLGSLLENGYTLTDRIEDAGAALYVTCSVRQHAEDRVLSKIGRLKARKKQDPDFVVGLLGCMAQNQPEVTTRKYPHIDIFCGTAEFLRIPQLIEEARDSGPIMAIDLAADLKFERRRNYGPRRFQAFVSVMRGCDMTCTFCIVPKTRGKEISRPVAEIVDECKALVDDGVREVTLLGQTVNSYGKTLAPGRRIGLQHILHELNKLSGLDRIRFITSHPRFMNSELIEAMGELDSVCEYLHLPVQSGSDPVLKRMNRVYTADHYRKVITECREKIPDFALATDFIVGFPGETDDDFEKTCALMEEMDFQGSFVFKYSPRPDTKANDYPDDVPEPVKQERNQRLLAIQEKLSTRIYRERVGHVDEVLVEGPSRNDARRYTGRNRRHQIVVFPLPDDIRGSDVIGKLLPIKIVDSTALTLHGELLATREGRVSPSTSAESSSSSCGDSSCGDGSSDGTTDGKGFIPVDGIRLIEPDRS